MSLKLYTGVHQAESTQWRNCFLWTFYDTKIGSIQKGKKTSRTDYEMSQCHQYVCSIEDVWMTQCCEICRSFGFFMNLFLIACQRLFRKDVSVLFWAHVPKTFQNKVTPLQIYTSSSTMCWNISGFWKGLLEPCILPMNWSSELRVWD